MDAPATGMRRRGRHAGDAVTVALSQQPHPDHVPHAVRAHGQLALHRRIRLRPQEVHQVRHSEPDAGTVRSKTQFILISVTK